MLGYFYAFKSCAVFTVYQSTCLRVSSLQRDKSKFHYFSINIERNGSVVECLTRDREAAGSSLTGVTAFWSFEQNTFILALNWFDPGIPVPV